MFRTDRDQVFDARGKLLSEEVVQVDVTAEVVEVALHEQVRDALAANRTFLALASPTAAQNAAQVRALTRQVTALTRLTIRKLDGTD